ncbi:polysaccharide transporter, PST family [Geodermatophilus telluris]|uniref:Polysaccharide transporter, PST family n=1 Tax=Geodermatophilus telluris TaxID=1190417 RepID=A0A1G6LA70_9ACTN|nr:oligosaccharide flippase family protein [Geodermatophilus telluris]SDC39456.1 polysaccharide transporter, PST family [Geodermatophilus telluris]
MGRHSPVEPARSAEATDDSRPDGTPSDGGATDDGPPVAPGRSPVTAGPDDVATASEPPAQRPPEGQDLTRAGASGAAWLGGAQVAGKLVTLLTTVLLARLLTPAEFGLVSLALVLLVYAEAIADAGVAQALIYLERTRAAERAALLCSLVAGLLLLGLVQLAAPLIAGFFGHPEVEPLVRLLSLSLFCNSLAALPDALMRRELAFRRVVAAAMVRTVVTGVVSVVLAFAGAGAYAIVGGTVAGAVSYVVAAWLLTPQRPDVAFWRAGRADVRSVLGYGAPVAGSTLLAKLVFDVDYLVVGRILGATALGYYTLAFRLPEMVILNVFFVLSVVVFPLYTKMRGDLGRLQNGYLFSLRVYALYGVTTGVGLAVTAPLLVPLLFGPQWGASVAPLVALALYCACRSLSGGSNEVYKALGRPGLSLVVSLARLAVLVPALALAALQWGIVGVAWAQFATSLLFAVVVQVVAARMLQLRWWVLARSVLPSLVVGAAVAAVGVALSLLPLPTPLLLAVVVVGGAAAAAGTLAVAFPSVLRELLAIVRRRGPVAA